MLSFQRSFRNNATRWTRIGMAVIVSAFAGIMFLQHPHAATLAPGQDYQICDAQASQYLTSPWTYHALSSGKQTYTASQYKALAGYGTTLPPLPDYIANQGPAVTAAIIYAPGSTPSGPAYNFPSTPILQFFEGGAYPQLGMQSVSGDLFIGGSAAGFPEPTFDNGGSAGGIDAGNDSYGFSGGTSTLSAAAAAGTKTITTATAIPGYINYATFADGTTYQIASSSGTTITLSANLTANQAAGSQVWANVNQPISKVSSAASQGGAQVSLGASTMPLVQWGEVRVGAQAYQITSVSGAQTGYTINVGALDKDVAANTPVYYNAPAGGVTISYLDIAHDAHNTTGTFNTGAGWTITHNSIHDGGTSPGMGVAIYGGDQGLIEYNCMNKMGDYGVNIFGTNNIFRHNEIANTNAQADPGCGCSGGGKWWGTLNADIVANAWVNDGPGNGSPIWLDNGNTGTNISDNYFTKSYGSAIHSETGFNLNITNNYFENGGWASGSGQGDNNNGAVNINSSGGFPVPGSRYNNQIIVANNQFINNWEGVTIWQAGARSCNNSGEDWPNDASYCSGGFPVTATTAAGGQYYFSHMGRSNNQGASTAVDQAAAAGSTTILVSGVAAINDQIGFSDPVSTTTSSTANVTSLTGSATIAAASTASFAASGQLRVGTSAAWSDGGGSYTGAVLAYTGKTATSFTGVSLLRGKGTLAGPVMQVQPYQVLAQTCYANDCKVTISPGLTSAVAAGTAITNAGTCQLFATSAATPTNPMAPNGISYWDGCQWEARNVSVTGNNFVFDPTAIANGTPIAGNRTNTTCTAAHANSCGTNFMAYQLSGEAPFNDNTGANALMSNSNLTGCPAWDSGCSVNPLKNLNALPSPPGGAPANNGAIPGNIVWTNNTYTGPWQWNVYTYGTCTGITDTTTNKSMPSGACTADLAHWQSNWQQDSSNTPPPPPPPPPTPTPTPPPPPPPSGKVGDINSDNQVNLTDLSILLSNWNKTTSSCDLNKDGTVNLTDLSILLSHWGT